MKLETCPFILLSIALTLALLTHPTSINASTDLVQEVCSHSHNKDNCISSLRSNPDSQNATMKQLGIIALRLASSNGTSTSLHIKSLLNDTSSLDPVIEQALSDCYDLYLDAIAQLDNSLAAILSDANKDVQTWVKTAITDIESCEDGFKGKNSVVAPRSAMFRQLCNNVLAIVKLLKS